MKYFFYFLVIASLRSNPNAPASFFGRPGERRSFSSVHTVSRHQGMNKSSNVTSFCMIVEY